MKVTLFASLLFLVATSVDGQQRVLDPNDVRDKEELIRTVAALLGRDLDPEDPDAQNAAEAFLVADAAKAYAFTKVHAVPLEFCPDDGDLAEALSAYETDAARIISLGKHYYEQGLDVTVGDRRIQHSGEALRSSLDELLDDQRREVADLNEAGQAERCRQARAALVQLRQLYAG